MKTITFFSCLSLILISCNFSAGVKKDFQTGLSYKYSGFTVDEVVLAGPDNAQMKNNEVAMNTEVAVVMQGLGNYQLKEGKAFPGLMLSVTDDGGSEVLGAEDLFAQTTGYSEADASILRGTITVGNPMKAGETYHVKMRAWDKNKPENELVAEVDLVVK